MCFIYRPDSRKKTTNIKIIREKMGTSGQGDAFDLKKFIAAFNMHLDNIGERAEDTQNPPRITTEFLVSVPNSKPQSKKCQICNGNHAAYECKVPINEKFHSERTKRLCFNCLGTHPAKEYRSQKSAVHAIGDIIHVFTSISPHTRQIQTLKEELVIVDVLLRLISPEFNRKIRE
jgi:hypothetical protein